MTVHTWGQFVATPEEIVEKERRFDTIIRRTLYTRVCSNCGASMFSYAEDGPAVCAFKDCETYIEATTPPQP